jgi:hypothetical protein
MIICFHERKYRWKADQKFHAIAQFIKKFFVGLNGEALVAAIAKNVFKNSGDRLKEQIRDSLDQYRTDFEVPDFSLTDPLLHYCQENNFFFTFATIQKNAPKYFERSAIELRGNDFPNLYKCVMELFRKQVDNNHFESRG